jgi:hypothetical protein
MTDPRPMLQARAALLMAAGRAAESLEQRCTLLNAPTVTISRDELAEIADQFQRVVSMMTITHLAEAQAAKQRHAA